MPGDPDRLGREEAGSIPLTAGGVRRSGISVGRGMGRSAQIPVAIVAVRRGGDDVVVVVYRLLLIGQSNEVVLG